MDSVEGAPCAFMAATDGTSLRVQGHLTQEDADLIVAAVRRREDGLCGAASPFPMPVRAQGIHGRETYLCQLQRHGEGTLHEAFGHAWA